VQRSIQAELPQALDRGGRLVLGEQVHQLVPYPGARDRRQGVLGDRDAGGALAVLVHVEAEPRLVADGAQQPGRVIEERVGVKDAHDARLQIREAAIGVVQVPEVVAEQGDGHRVDREVAAAQVLVERGGLDVRQRPRLAVRLGARGGEVEDELRRPHGRGPEALMLAHDAAQAIGQRPPDRARISLHGKVEVDRVRAAQQVADGPAHQVHGRQAGERGQQPLHGREAPDALAQVGVGARHAVRVSPGCRPRACAPSPRAPCTGRSGRSTRTAPRPPRPRRQRRRGGRACRLRRWR
jgi:hypothetical protein